ncbi:MAG: hypothetical protein Fur0037_24110 [Planctomycetota bacterium]
MPVLSVFQFLSRTRKSGTLHVQVGDEHIGFEFVNGLIEESRSDANLPGERLGDILLELFPARASHLQSLLQSAGESAAVRRLGAELVEKGIVSNGQVMEALERQVLKRYRRVAQSPDASYWFAEGTRVPGDGRIRIRPFELEFASRKADS